MKTVERSDEVSRMKKSKKITALAGLLALTVVAGTLAYFSKEMAINNPFATQKYGGETIEKFTPELNWEPGGQVTKEVQAKNTGDYPLYVRVKFDEKWERGEGKNKTEIQSLSSVTATEDGSKKNTAFFPTSADVDVSNALTTNASSVYKHLVNTGDWEDKGDGWFYYKTELAAGAMTSQLMDYVTLCNQANMGTYDVTTLYAVVDASKTADQLTDADYNLTEAPGSVPAGKVMYQKVVTKLDDSNAGLAGANYTLTITTQLLQADANAAKEAKWGYTPTVAGK